MEYFIGLDVSQRQTAICVLDGEGEVFAEGKATTEPGAIHGWLAAKSVHVGSIVKAGLEAGAMSHWLSTGLKEMGWPIVCLETFQAHRFLKTCRNKTDKNDARGLAQLIRMGGAFIRPVAIRSQVNQEARMLLTLRESLVHQKVKLENNITGSLKPFGIVVPRGTICAATFRERVIAILDKAEALGLRLRDGIMPSLNLYESLSQELGQLTKQVEAVAKKHPVCRKLMTAPGVGPIISLSFVTAIDNPQRFSNSEDIGAYFGLTPKQYQSGETDQQLGISRLGNAMTRQHLVQAATVLLISTRSWSALKAWGMKIAKKRGFSKARIAVARKLAVILHRMWINDEPFRWTAEPEANRLARQAAS